LDLDEREIQLLQQYPWPGNVRELRNVLERSCILHKNRLRPSELLYGANGKPSGKNESPALILPEQVPLEALEKSYILETLRNKEGNLTQAAKALGISLSTLKRKMKLYR